MISKISYFCVIFILISTFVYGQTEIKKTFTPKKQVSTGPNDSALYSGSNTQVNDSTKLYVLAGFRMEEYAAAADTLRRGQVKDLVAQIEDEVKERFSQDLRKLTFKQGIVLLKLLDRQTSKTGYAIIKEIKNGFSAMIFQSLASLFDFNLKDEFDPNNVQEDEWINEICIGIDEGRIK